MFELIWQANFKIFSLVSFGDRKRVYLQPVLSLKQSPLIVAQSFKLFY